MGKKLTYIAGPCVLEDMDTVKKIAESVLGAIQPFGNDIDFYFKASFDKANRTQVTSYRGPGIEEGLKMLQSIKTEYGVKILTDIHTPDQASIAAEVVDVLQIPAFLSRQTDILVESGKTGKTVNIKKAQFMSPQDLEYAIRKVESTGNKNIWLTERGVCMGYNTLVVDFRSFSVLKSFGYPVIFDATHAVQIPSQGGVSAGNREYVLPLARAAAAYGIDGLFTECHINPEQAKSDAANSLYMKDLPTLLKQVFHASETINIQ